MVAPMEEVDEPKYFSNTVVLMNSSRFKQFKSTSYLQNFHRVTQVITKKIIFLFTKWTNTSSAALLRI